MTLYRERLWPSVGLLVALLLVVPACILVFQPINPTVGVIVAIALYLGSALLLIVTSPVIEVTRESLKAGRASLPIGMVGDATAYEGEDATKQRGPVLDTRAWLVIRGWIPPVVRIEVADSADPTPYWLVSSRRPDALVQAVAQARSGA
ncbi:DUF3093 family protein [Homoserinimonas aerilata]|uniref:DUF3093 family protein n=1 Tax=Homoserinimonas aerilata TaxID=1162970 RepID=A0A542YIX4_9MICO|nr:DUF3093 domain-containing protein [Homoserinimonas aerilata]TQL47924.1 DUF3093 family protein [Homoserinimonas aerilata]